jgi:indolepyruvate ferredoxin oxidoreductase alpha subunit
VYNRHDFLLVILDNGTTGMTGHQPHPGVDVSHLNIERSPIDIEAVVRGLGVQNVFTVNPLHFRKTVEAVGQASACKGPSVLIAKALCPLYFKTLPGHKSKTPYTVRRDRCKNSRLCVDKTGCPAFSVTSAGVEIDALRCAGCSLCAQLCPEKAIVPISREIKTA